MAEQKTTKKEAVKKTADKVKTPRKRTPKHIGLVAKDPYLEPYEDAILYGKSTNSHETAKPPCATSLQAMTISGCTRQPEDGSSVNGRQQQQTYILSVISMTGKRQKNTVQRELKAQGTGS